MEQGFRRRVLGIGLVAFGCWLLLQTLLPAFAPITRLSPIEPIAPLPPIPPLAALPPLPPIPPMPPAPPIPMFFADNVWLILAGIVVLAVLLRAGRATERSSLV